MTHEFYIDETNEVTGPVCRWNSNDRVPFEDMLTTFLNQGLIDQLVFANSVRTREAEVDEFLAEYRRNYRGPSAEERFEARAAHGPGVVLMDMVTGHRWTT